MSARGKEALLAAIRNGKGFIGVHSASDTFHSKEEPYETQPQLDPYIAMLGGEFLSHGSQQRGARQSRGYELSRPSGLG
jgi:type 1 glutamine amidotransferase